ncbi:MAG: formyltransferase family protein, partial [Pseudomonadota bacterium]|nr:formyltransferase family protein [Pseudomonadota bacterium]
VRPAMDEGPIIVQAAGPILADDDAESLGERVLTQEHLIYPLALRLIGEGKVHVDGERAIVDEVTDQLTCATINPSPPKV